eukprot:TRINITY_DN133006_c0_g1_i1.p1 TRINITY_DN133006_c0_g1~~TRINITY_DN133006_c0_g1_i1.p1  ORF type:complete len:100 (+),score=2.13 TRINITY_DN133006_c0_g1_i1:35-301(+)
MLNVCSSTVCSFHERPRHQILHSRTLHTHVLTCILLDAASAVFNQLLSVSLNVNLAYKQFSPSLGVSSTSLYSADPEHILHLILLSII